MRGRSFECVEVSLFDSFTERRDLLTGNMLDRDLEDMDESGRSVERCSRTCFIQLRNGESNCSERRGKAFKFKFDARNWINTLISEYYCLQT